MNKRLLTPVGALLLSLGLLLSACSGGDGEGASPEPTDAATETVAEVTPTPEATPLPYDAPLTGLKLAEEATARPVVVMINNYAAARPQSGLTNADAVWEVLAEGGITRLVAVFQSTDALTDNIGPIRSIRPYLIDIGDSYGAVLAHAGASNDGYAILQRQDKPYLDEISNAGGSYWRSKDRKAPHNLYSSLEKLREGADKKGYRKDVTVPSYPFKEEGAAEAGEPATEIAIKFLMDNYKVGYKYDAATGLYERSIGDEPHIDLNNGEQLSGANLVVIGASHRTLDNEGRLAVDLTAGGSAVLFQKGKAIEAEWVRAPDGMIRIVRDGEELPLVPGKTFFHIVPTKPTFAEHVTWVQS
ncbi:DUF3048 domain-containing protein [Paenibacillus arenilitoris]|uniref:DUF3048 domain-containing protein n=1 Tax=Paenibacillus arenilitoris TaxID=2772299 RepID=A0A927H6U9_9BACL|nr:DUF3048 domain-containing protein [Paenibacillus arenilitoris]MBD2868939.1 DUF3048 domain-containing protein [Paenibacillus arenilitoris]